jgi:cyclic pyranopterin phosphate synthase
MANILLTSKCVRECPYCFAGEEMASSPGGYISWENIIYLADLLRASGESRVSLLGGEPTLHPEFLDILLYLIERGFDVTAFTCGIMSKTKLDDLARHVAALPHSRVTFVCNLNNPEQTGTPASETAKLHAFLAALGPWTMPGFNIYRPDFELDFLFDLVARYDLKKRLRLGIAHPIPGAPNESIRVEEIGGVIARLYSYREAFDSLRLRPHFDCGFALCRVSDEQLGWLTRMSGRIDFKCKPAIDITPDMQVYCCFPLSGLNRKSVFEFNSFREIAAYYRDLQTRFRTEQAGIYEECGTCHHFSEGTCAGGGVCQIVNRLAKEDPSKLHDIERTHGEACL